MKTTLSQAGRTCQLDMPAPTNSTTKHTHTHTNDGDAYTPLTCRQMPFRSTSRHAQVAATPKPCTKIAGTCALPLESTQYTDGGRKPCAQKRAAAKRTGRYCSCSESRVTDGCLHRQEAIHEALAGDNADCPGHQDSTYPEDPHSYARLREPALLSTSSSTPCNPPMLTAAADSCC
jgi:hypothetical protein